MQETDNPTAAERRLVNWQEVARTPRTSTRRAGTETKKRNSQEQTDECVLGDLRWDLYHFSHLHIV